MDREPVLIGKELRFCWADDGWHLFCPFSISSYWVWRHKANDSIDDVVARWQESVPWHRVHRCRQRVHRHRFRLSADSPPNRTSVKWLHFCGLRHFVYWYYTVSQKNCANLFFCQNFVKFRPIMKIFGKNIAKRTSFSEVYSLSTSPNLCQRIKAVIIRLQ